MPGIAAKSQSAERQSPQDTPTKGNFVEMDYGSWEQAGLQVAVAQTKSESIVSKASRESINADEQPPISEERDHDRCGSRQGPPHYRLKQPEPLWTIGLHEIGQEEPAGGTGARRPMSVRGSASDTPVPPTPSPRMVLAKQQRQSGGGTWPVASPARSSRASVPDAEFDSCVSSPSRSRSQLDITTFTSPEVSRKSPAPTTPEDIDRMVEEHLKSNYVARVRNMGGFPNKPKTVCCGGIFGPFGEVVAEGCKPVCRPLRGWVGDDADPKIQML